MNVHHSGELLDSVFKMCLIARITIFYILLLRIIIIINIVLVVIILLLVIIVVITFTKYEFPYTCTTVGPSVKVLSLNKYSKSQFRGRKS